jgi:hypothetical protein
MTPRFIVGAGIKLPAGPTPYRWKPGDPLHRPLRVFTQDPSASRFDDAVAIVKVPWEPLEQGPSGALFVVRDFHEPSGRSFAPVHLDSLEVAIDQGLGATTTDPRFAQQMTYAIAMATYERFQLALGRLPEFAPSIREQGDGRLEIRPHFDEDDNAYYDPDLRALCFGYTRASKHSTGRLQEGANVFTCLSHDVIIHETSHALLDGMRPHLMLPSNPDVAAFHEGFADLIALLMRFRYKNIVKRALEDSNGSLDAKLLRQLALEWGRSGGDGRAALREVLLRSGAPDDPVTKEDQYDRRKEHHDLGAVLVAAVFEAMSRIFERKTSSLRKLLSISPGAQDQVTQMLAEEACDLASHFINIVIRAIDYCPPVDLTFGEFLRAMITADAVTVPDDTHCYREALVLAFRRYRIEVPDVADLSEGSLLWRAPERGLPPIEALKFSELRHGCEPGWFPPQAVREQRADALGEFVTTPDRHRFFGIVEPGRRDDGRYEAPTIESIRSLRRLTPDDDLDFHVVAEITQRFVRKGRSFYGGSTIVLDEDGQIRFVIGKGVRNERRRKATESFLAGAPAEFRAAFDGDRTGHGALIRRFHARSKSRKSRKNE